MANAYIQLHTRRVGGWVGWARKGPKHAYVIFEWSLFKKGLIIFGQNFLNRAIVQKPNPLSAERSVWSTYLRAGTPQKPSAGFDLTRNISHENRMYMRYLLKIGFKFGFGLPIFRPLVCIEVFQLWFGREQNKLHTTSVYHLTIYFWHAAILLKRCFWALFNVNFRKTGNEKWKKIVRLMGVLRRVLSWREI